MQHSGSIHPRLEVFASFVTRFLEGRGVPRPSEFEAVPVQSDGSERSFFRIRHPIYDHTFILILNPPISPFLRRENTAYLKIGNHLRAQGAPVPEIFQWDLEAGLFLVEDMGDVRLQDALSTGNHPQGLEEDVLTALFNMQVRGADGFDPAWCCQTARYDRECMRQFESNYFRDAFLSRYLGLDLSPHELDPSFDRLASAASRADARFFLHRDFQSRNVLVTGGGPSFLDWQGGRMGPLGYDLASFLIDPYTALPESHQDRLYRFYVEMLHDHDPSQTQSFEETYPYLAVQRNLQILGAFGFLARVREKPFFEAFIPAAALSLLGLLAALKDPLLDPIADVMESRRYLWL
ncbi:MAG: aminoglycoside phosphotransferase family protein [Thermodesulfobacteriota bacterium]